MNLQRLSIVSGVITFTVACTWVEPVARAESVALVNDAHVVSCQKLGQTTSNVKDKLGIIKRRQHKVSEELLTLAKNTAVEMGGDSVVALSEPSDGEQSFAIFRCQ